MLPRSDAEQLVGQELIKALNDFKRLVVAPLSPPAQQIYSSVKESNVKHLVSSQSFSCYQINKIKCQKSSVKVVRDLLMKNWIFIKRKDLKSAKPLCSGKLPPPYKNAEAPMMLSCEEGSCRQ
jgi:hypothetical protein